jgi:hypothetical protein
MPATEPHRDAVAPSWIRFRLPEPCAVKDLNAIGDRADQAVIDPVRTLVALSVHREPVAPFPAFPLAGPAGRDAWR